MLFNLDISYTMFKVPLDVNIHEESYTLPDANNDGHSSNKNQPSGIGYLYARILARYWYVICLLVFLVVNVVSAISFILYELPDISEPSKDPLFEKGKMIPSFMMLTIVFGYSTSSISTLLGFETRGTAITSRYRGLSNLMLHSDDLLTNIPQATQINGTLPSWQERTKRSDNSEFGSGVHFCHSVWDWNDYVATMVFETEAGGNILTLEAIKSVCTASERLVTTHPLYSKNCLCFGNYTYRDCPNTWSIGEHIALFNNKTSCADIVDGDIANTVDLLVQCAPYVYNRTRPELQSAEASSIPFACGQHDFAVHTILSYLLPLEFSEYILEHNASTSSTITAVFFPILGSNTDILETIYLESVSQQSNSDGVTSLKAVEFFIKVDLFNEILLVDSLYLGIGMAVIFLLIWMYTGSSLVTVGATLNMVFSLILGYFFFTVVFVRPFFPVGNIILASILIVGVGADDTFVFMDLWKKCKSEFGTDDLPLLIYETLRHATATMLVTSVTTTSALFATVISDITAIKCFAIYSGASIMMNFALTLTLLPAVIVMQHKFTLCCCSPSTTSSETGNSLSNTVLRPFKVLYEDFIPWLVLRFRLLWIILFVSLMTGSAIVIFYLPGLQLPTQSDFQFFTSSHFFEQFDFVYKKRFLYTQQQDPGFISCLVWGVQAVDNGDPWNPDDTGTLVLDETFKFSSPEEQMWLLHICAEIRNQSFFKSGMQITCFIEDFVDLMQHDCVNALTSEDTNPCCNQTSFPYDSSLFETCIKLFSIKGYFPSLYFNKDVSKLAAIQVIFPTVFPSSFNYATNDELWRTINDWTEDKLHSAPESLQGGWFLSILPQIPGVLFYDLQQSLAFGTSLSMLLTLALASIILLLTIQNGLLTILAIVTITSAVLVTVASLVLLGWELNVLEATIITLAVGLSVDFTIHYGVAYKLAPSADRKTRTRYSLTSMTAAITMAALSTFIAGALVLPATVLLYYQFGVFLMLVVSISWSHGTFFFQSLCSFLGPQDVCGDIPCLIPCCECLRLVNKPTKGIAPDHDELFSNNIHKIKVYETYENPFVTPKHKEKEFNAINDS